MATSTKSAASSAGSSRTSASSASVARARAKAEAAKVRASYATQEAKLKLEKASTEAERVKREAQSKLETARIDTELEVLTLQREADAAIVEAQVLEEADMTQAESENVSRKERRSEAEKIKNERTSEYVQSQISLQKLSSPFQTPVSAPVHAESFDSLVTWHPPVSNVPNIPDVAKAETTSEIKVASRTRGIDTQPCTPQYNQPTKAPTPVEPLAQYLARRDLVNTVLYQFDDKPENYRAWYSSFMNATREVNLTATQELDLMARWLGRESGEQVRRIRAVNVSDSSLALQRAWERLRECYAAPEIIERSLFKRLDGFPRISARENSKLRDLGDLLMEIQGAKEDGYLTGLSYLDTARGIGPIVEKLPFGLQEKWMSSGSWYKEENCGRFPPFEYFCNFVCHEAKKRNDPSFMHQGSFTAATKPDRFTLKSPNKAISVHKTDVFTTTNDPSKNCPLHKRPHPLRKCRSFRRKSLDERKAFLKEQGICFKCCSSMSHMAKDCRSLVKCSECDSSGHDTAMHPGSAPQIVKGFPPSQEDGGEEEGQASIAVVSTSCTEVCGLGQGSRSCAKICLARIYPKNARGSAIKAYVMLDDQSNRSLARPELFEQFNLESEPISYNLRTCSGIVARTGKKAEGFMVESLDGKIVIPLPPLIECHEILSNRMEIPTPDAVLHQPHLCHLAKHIPELDPEAEILLLLGRDVLRAHKVRQQINGPHNAPFAQRLDLGWVVIGDVCLSNVHKPAINVFKTHVLEENRHSIFQPCTSFMRIEETQQGFNRTIKPTERNLGCMVFNHTDLDNKPAPSVEDIAFLRIMNAKVYRNDTNHWVAPLPFKEPRQRLPDNKGQACNRFRSLQRTLRRKPEMQDQYTLFMEKLLANEHAEVAPPLKEDEECWYLPTFGVYHPQKPNQIRVVFDSSAQYSGVSLNDALLTGPDLNNSLLGVLLRFRKERVAVLADIQQMFYCFQVREDHRNFLRFLWHKDNDITKEAIDYRMKVHVFGNGPSPAVATYCLRRAIREGAHKYGGDTVTFVERNFYVDDGLISVPTEAEAINLLQCTQASLAESNIRLHKFVSNSQAVMEAFAPEDCAPVVKDLDLSGETVFTQRSLGLLWEVTTDTFTFSVSTTNKPFTRRGVLSTVNSVFDPLGLLAPIMIQGRALLREYTLQQVDWDTLLPEEKRHRWEAWRDSLQELKQLHIPRSYTATSLTKAVCRQLCVFSDASTKAIGVVVYLRAIQENGQSEVGFVMGKAKLVPLSEPTVPRLELCTAVLAVEMADLIQEELDLKLDTTEFYTDSRVVLGYIYNETKRFYTYVHNRVQRIRQSSKPEQWHYVCTKENPADHASRALPVPRLMQTSWFTGPSFLHRPPAERTQAHETFDLVQPEKDAEIRPQVQTCATCLAEPVITSNRFQRFSTFTSLVRGIAFLVHIARTYQHSNQSNQCKGWHRCELPRTLDEMAQARDVVFKTVQKAAFAEELSTLQTNKSLSKNSPLQKLNPILERGLIRVGGRLKYSGLTAAEKHPIVLPKDSHISLLLTRYHHEQVKHQGRHLTEGAIRAAGLWILGGKKLINSVIHRCVTCKKLRGKPEEQCMADLPPERLRICPPFTYVGVDVFGPWSVSTRRTRGGQVESKRWAIMFSCLSSRAVHIEIIESLDTSSCINALRRFFALRGPVKQLRSDCGTNFRSACKELGMNQKVQRYLCDQGCSWEFNPPHASHHGGSWERMIGVGRRILDAMFLQQNVRLTHEVLCTLMAEVTAIMNARPLVPVSTDPENPFILSPAMLITQKSGVPPPPGDFSEKDLLTKQWRQVQALANQFWTRWRQEYLPSLQPRQKWTVPQRNLQVGDLVLLRDKQAARNCWPMARVTATFPGKDGHVRKVEVKTVNQDSIKTFLRPIPEVILLLPKD